MRYRAKGIARDDSGIALLTVLGVIAVVTVLSVGSFYLAMQTLFEAERVESETKAFRAANSGLDQQLATFTDADVANWPEVSHTGYTPDGTYVLTLEDFTGGEYRLVSTGTGTDGTEESVSQQFFFMNLWEMNFAGNGPQSLITGGGTLTGGSNIVGPFYMKGNLDIAASMMVLEGPIFVRDGDIYYQSGIFGTSDKGVAVFCNQSISQLTGSKVFLGRTSTSVPDIQLPIIQQTDLDMWAGKAKAESVDNRMGSALPTPTVTNIETDDTHQPSSYKTVQPPSSGTYSRTQYDNTNANYKFIGDVDGVIAGKGLGEYPLTISSTTPSFGCWGPTNEGGISPTLLGDSSGAYAANVHDDFAWDAVNGILYVEGTVFVDGDLTFSRDIVYVGNGSIIANGDVLITGSMRAAGTTPQARTNKWVLGIASPTTVTFTCNTPQVMGGNPTAQDVRDRLPDIGGAIYAERSVTTAPKLLVQGSVITGTINAGQNNLWLVTNPLLPTYLPESLPGAGGGLMMPGLWTRF